MVRSTKSNSRKPKLSNRSQFGGGSFLLFYALFGILFTGVETSNFLFCSCMRKFAFKTVVACVAGFFVAQGSAQPRDLFAEFEAENAAAESSSSVAASSSSVVASSSSVTASSSSVAVSSSSVAVSSSSVSSSSVASSSSVVSSSSVTESSSSLTPEEEYARAMAKMNAERQEAIRQATEQARIADSIRQAELPQDSAMRAQDSLMDIQDRLLDVQTATMPVYSSSSEEAAESSSSSVEVSAAPSSSSMSRRDLLGPVKVSKVNGMDEIKGKYKDPRKALFMSLVIPGSGQLYTGGTKFTTIRGAVYLALEAGLWGGWYYYSVYKYGKQVKKYKDYAKEHYSIGRYERAMRDLYDAAGADYSEVFRSRYLGSRESFCEAIYGDAKARGCYSANLYTNDAGYMNDFVNKPVALENEMKNVKFDNANEVYSLIAGDAYVLGWDVVSNTKKASELDLVDPNASTVSLASSEAQKEYRSLRNKANGYADMQAWFFGGLILNHVLSAVDAALTANAYNKTLYQEDLSWYDHIHLDGGFSWVDGLGVNVQASWGF